MSPAPPAPPAAAPAAPAAAEPPPPPEPPEPPPPPEPPEPAPPPAYYVKGDDPSLVAQAVRALVADLVGPRDPTLVVEEHGGAATDIAVGPVIDACTTPPFLVDRRVVVVRDAGRLAAADAPRLAAVAARPAPGVHLVVAAGGGTVPQALVRALGAAGRVIDASAGRGRERGNWFADQVRQSPVRLEPAAIRRLEAHLGEDVGRLAGLLETLAAAYGPGATVSAGALEPFLGEAGAVPPWDLTDAIDAGEAARALSALRRMLEAGGRPAPVVLAILHTHVSNMLRLDGAAVTSGEEAAALLGARSPFVAKKAMERARRLGSERIGQAIVLVAEADLDLKGRTALPPETVLEVLVARLARLAPRATPRR